MLRLGGDQCTDSFHQGGPVGTAQVQGWACREYTIPAVVTVLVLKHGKLHVSALYS